MAPDSERVDHELKNQFSVLRSVFSWSCVEPGGHTRKLTLLIHPTIRFVDCLTRSHFQDLTVSLNLEADSNDVLLVATVCQEGFHLGLTSI